MANEVWSGGVNESYGSGTIPKANDPCRKLLVKRLRALIANKGAVSADRYPKVADTKRVLRNKIVRVLDGI